MNLDPQIQRDTSVPGSSVLADGDLVLAVRCVLQWRASLPLGAITIRVRRGWVSMDGEIDCDFLRQNIGAAVQLLVGVRGVHDPVGFRSGGASVPERPTILQWRQSADTVVAAV